MRSGWAHKAILILGLMIDINPKYVFRYVLGIFIGIFIGIFKGIVLFAFITQPMSDIMYI